jgi:hypothetical protein
MTDKSETPEAGVPNLSACFYPGNNLPCDNPTHYMVPWELVERALAVSGEPPPPEEVQEQFFAMNAASHWFIQGGTAQFGDLARQPQNADELISEILTAVRSRLAVSGEAHPPPKESVVLKDSELEAMRERAVRSGGKVRFTGIEVQALLAEIDRLVYESASGDTGTSKENT